jgi:hypothetical protein
MTKNASQIQPQLSVVYHKKSFHTFTLAMFAIAEQVAFCKKKYLNLFSEHEQKFF